MAKAICTTLPLLKVGVFLLILSLADAFSQIKLGERTNHLGPLEQSSRRVGANLGTNQLGPVEQSSRFDANLNDRAQNATPKVLKRLVIGPPADTKPDYERIVGPLGKTIDNIFLKVFRAKLAEQVGSDSALPATDFKAITELAATMNKRFTNRLEIQQRAKDVLSAIFPSWLPKSYAILFAKPFPAVSTMYSPCSYLARIYPS
jgi:hypothetical protein